MKRVCKRIITLLFAVLFVVGAAFPASAAGAITPATGTQTVYLTGPVSDDPYGYSYVYLLLASGTKKFAIKENSVTLSPGKTGAVKNRFEKYSYTYQYEDEYNYSTSGKWRKAKYSGSNCEYHLSLQVYKPGVATVKYKIGSKKYTTKVKVLPYTNPVKKITLTGVNGGGNFAALTQKENYASVKLPADVAGSTLKITPKKGWKISYVRFYTESGYREYNFGLKGIASFSVPVGAMRADSEYSISIEYVNSANGGSLYTHYWIEGANYDYGYYEDY